MWFPKFNKKKEVPYRTISEKYIQHVSNVTDFARSVISFRDSLNKHFIPVICAIIIMCYILKAILKWPI